MQKGVLVSIAALLAACGAVATTSNDAAESAPQKKQKAKQQPVIGMGTYDRGGMAGCFDPNLSGHARAAAERIGGVPCAQSAAGQAGGDDWSGNYGGSADGGSVTAQIRSAGRNAYRVEITTANPETSCGGSINGVGTASGNRLSFSDTMSMGQYGNAQCTMRLTRQGNRLNVSGAGDCHYWSGMSCGFNGTYTRLGGASGSTSAAPSLSRSWLVGAWVSRGFECGGDGVIYAADGTYASDAQSGRWSLSGNTLTETALQMVEMGEDETPIRNPRPVRSQIMSVAPNRNAFTMRTADGEVWHMVRCR